MIIEDVNVDQVVKIYLAGCCYVKERENGRQIQTSSRWCFILFGRTEESFLNVLKMKSVLFNFLKGISLSIKKHPCNIFITGPSSCGKTEFVHKLIDYRGDLFNIVPERVAWCYKEWQQSYSLMQEKFNSQFELIKFVEGIPVDENEIVSDVSVPHLIVFDDMLGVHRNSHDGIKPVQNHGKVVS